MVRWAIWRAVRVPSVADAEAMQQVLGDLSTLAIRDVVQLFRRYGSDPGFASILLAAFPDVIGPYLQGAALTSAQVYDEMAPALAYKATPAAAIAADRMAGSVRWALYALGSALPVDRLAGAAQRMVFDASRQTMLTNLAAEYDVSLDEVAASPGTRWARHASANACSFCKVMATRGAVYRSKASAEGVTGRGVELTTADRRRLRQGRGFASMSDIPTAEVDEALSRRSRYVSKWAADKVGKTVGDEKTRGALRGSQQYGDKFHDHCRCTAIPVRPGESYEPAPYVEQWTQDYNDAVGAARAAGRTRGQYGAIDLKSVVSEMDKAARAAN